MSWLRAFWTQPNRRYRDFQIVFTLLTLNFAIPAVSYVLAPQVATETFSRIGEILGGGPYRVPEHESRLWRYLGAGNVMTLAFMCALLQWDLRRYYPVLVPLTFLKACDATLLLSGYFATGYPAFVAAALFDYLTCAAFVFFARRGYAEIAG